jgi:SAM-dependent methyltransferase/uncharacterized protein YbaR (Trm112 family)
MTSWQIACPHCRSDLGEIEGSVTSGALHCPNCVAAYTCDAGVWELLEAGRLEHFDAFLTDYSTVRRAEGRGSTDPGYYLRLPEPTDGDPLAWQWAIRRHTWDHVRDRVLPTLGPRLRVLDVGAGVGWLSHRLSELGHEPMAIDLLTDPLDGLGAATHFSPTWPRVRAEFDRLPLHDSCCDLVIYNASLHYSTDYVVTLGEAMRVLRPGGHLMILESPVYRRDDSGPRMVAERHRQFEAQFGTLSNSVPSIEFLTERMLIELGATLGLRWRRSTPWYGWRWWWRPYRARLRRRREPSRFHVLIAEPLSDESGSPAHRR